MIDVETLSEDELYDLHNRIVDRINFLEQLHCREKMLEFSIGDRVTFTPDNRPQVTGILTKYNRKTVTVVSDGGPRWNVDPVFLQRVTDVGQETTAEMNVVPLFKEPGRS